MLKRLENKTIALGVSGGIASYKAAELARLLVRQGASVFVTYSSNAERFITPLTFQALTGNPVYKNVFQSEDLSGMSHIRKAEQADIYIIAPASANVIGKLSNGLGDDALSTLFLAYDGPVLLAPAMNEKMWKNSAVKDNLERLRLRGIEIIKPLEGELACGAIGPGRLAEPIHILDAICQKLSRENDLINLKILITSGPTREFIDPIRFITNRSSGKMGFAIAEQARSRGACVTLVTGPCFLPVPQGVRVVNCQSADEMGKHVLDLLPNCDALVMAAAVGDFSPENVSQEKIKKNGSNQIHLKLVPSRDILQEVAHKKSNQIVIGFAAETENIIPNALSKLKHKKLDIIVVNDVSLPEIGFESDDNQVTLISGESSLEDLPKMSKWKIADILLDRILSIADTKRVKRPN